MTDLEVDHAAMLAAVRREAEMWRTAKDRMAERCIAAEAAADKAYRANAAWHRRAEAAEAARDALLTDLEALLSEFKLPSTRGRLQDLIAKHRPTNGDE
jgi:hypothetical protein